MVYRIERGLSDPVRTANVSEAVSGMLVKTFLSAQIPLGPSHHVTTRHAS